MNPKLSGYVAQLRTRPMVFQNLLQSNGTKTRLDLNSNIFHLSFTLSEIIGTRMFGIFLSQIKIASKQLINDPTLYNETDASLKIEKIDQSHSGVYQCKVR